MPVGSMDIDAAAEGGHLEMLISTGEEGTCTAAARGGHLEILQWA
eukprot:CAMPEP_0118939182 /NCGR_PEP_ID=MMETSP1169-20130426/28207_1 /TAXON_ID=36882 /ORGANISM="Pyramimonas obovata, Strain CCMP722" /LENGTH=44 /DNA_ID= /DNA_START= /DNA_END= /DNA_ORIENTATION=